MYFYPQHINQQAVLALQAVELEFKGDEMFIPDSEYISEGESAFIARGVRLHKSVMTFSGHRDAPKTYSTLEGDMVPSGVDSYQCHTCGYWMDRKMTLSDERQHERQCRPQYEWRLV